jgi:hypothetical protein
MIGKGIFLCADFRIRVASEFRACAGGLAHGRLGSLRYSRLGGLRYDRRDATCREAVISGHFHWKTFLSFLGGRTAYVPGWVAGSKHVRFTIYDLRVDRRNDDLGSMEPSVDGWRLENGESFPAYSRLFPDIPAFYRKKNFEIRCVAEKADDMGTARSLDGFCSPYV